jgi:SagB-type dehydrogenase family enzyme
MKKFIFLSITAIILLSTLAVCGKKPKGEYFAMEQKKIIELPLPQKKGKLSVEEAISKRRSIRNYLSKELTIEQLSQLVWSAQGITDQRSGFRAAPSAGALYPLEIICVIKNVGDLKPGIYRYLPKEHAIVLQKEGDFQKDLSIAALSQNFIAQAPLNIVITADYNRIKWRYGERGIMYTHIEVGHVGQNLYLQAEALGLGTCAVGAFYDHRVADLLDLPKNLDPLYIMPIGYPK